MRNLAIRNSVMGGTARPYLRRVAYLASTGTQYIIPGVAANGIDIWIKPQNINSVYGAIGTWNGGSQSFGAIKYTTVQNRGWVFATNPTTIITGDLTFDFTRVVWRGGKVIVHGAEYSCPFTFHNYAALFGGTKSTDKTTVNMQSCQIGEVTLYQDDEIVMHLIPVLDLGGRPAFYEDSGAFLYNQGTGEFGYGELSQLGGGLNGNV